MKKNFCRGGAKKSHHGVQLKKVTSYSSPLFYYVGVTIPNQISSSNQLTIPVVRLMESESLNRSSNEIEKDRIRKEIIAEEVARRRMLELEVRRELMMEREIAISCGSKKRFAERMLFKEKMGMGVSTVSRHDKDLISVVPSRYHAVEPNISTLNQSPKAEILQLQPPGVNEILLVRVLLYCLPYL
ncbi:hypothetical protein AABB24_017127 [Solanum stoloniferum]|uniref:Uncharacterized protein n=2 Tax=Solanum stoloniferum TaxID=62892 RepID=A0ABD2TKV8_9SOLN